MDTLMVFVDDDVTVHPALRSRLRSGVCSNRRVVLVGGSSPCGGSVLCKTGSLRRVNLVPGCIEAILHRGGVAITLLCALAIVVDDL